MSEETRKAALREFMAKREVEGRELGITSEYTFKSGWDAGDVLFDGFLADMPTKD